MRVRLLPLRRRRPVVPAIRGTVPLRSSPTRAFRRRVQPHTELRQYAGAVHARCANDTPDPCTSAAAARALPTGSTSTACRRPRCEPSACSRRRRVSRFDRPSNSNDATVAVPSSSNARLNAGVAPRARDDTRAVQRTDPLVVSFYDFVDRRSRDQPLLDQQRLDGFCANRRRLVSFVSHRTAPGTARTDRDGRRRRLRRPRPIVPTRRTRPCRDAGDLRRGRVRCFRDTPTRRASKRCNRAFHARMPAGACDRALLDWRAHPIADTKACGGGSRTPVSRFRRLIVDAIGRWRRPRRDQIVRRGAEFDRAPSDRGGVEDAGFDDPRLEAAQPTPVVSVRQIGDRIDAFDRMPEVIDVSLRATIPSTRFNPEYAALPASVKDRLVRFANHRSESVFAAEVVYPVHRCG